MIDPLIAPPQTFLISVLDDEGSVRNSLFWLLSSLGYTVTIFGHVDDFLKSPSLRETSCLILDVRMPGLSGLDLQDILLTLGVSIPIIFITGYADEQIRAEALAKGAVGLLEKPFDEQDLIQLLNKALLPPYSSR